MWTNAILLGFLISFLLIGLPILIWWSIIKMHSVYIRYKYPFRDMEEFLKQYNKKYWRF